VTLGQFVKRLIGIVLDVFDMAWSECFSSNKELTLDKIKALRSATNTLYAEAVEAIPHDETHKNTRIAVLPEGNAIYCWDCERVIR
jgi:hypothetical protein